MNTVTFRRGMVVDFTDRQGVVSRRRINRVQIISGIRFYLLAGMGVMVTDEAFS